MSRLSLYIVMSVFLFSGCSYIEAYQVRSKAKDQISADYERVLGAEFDDTIGSANQRRGDFTKFILNHTNLDVKSVREVSKDHYLVSVTMHTIAGDTRRTLLGIYKPLTGHAMTSFNFADAISVVHQQDPTMKIESDQTLDIEVQN